MASGAARAVRNRGAKRVGFAPTVVVPTARAHGVNMMSVATAHEPPRGAAPFAADEENSGRSRTPEPCGTVLATIATGVRVRFASFRPLLAGHFDQRCERRASAAAAALLQPLIALLERQLFATETALRTQHSSF